jgi:hypothetical protein
MFALIKSKSRRLMAARIFPSKYSRSTPSMKADRDPLDPMF